MAGTQIHGSLPQMPAEVETASPDLILAPQPSHQPGLFSREQRGAQPSVHHLGCKQAEGNNLLKKNAKTIERKVNLFRLSKILMVKQ